MTSTTTTTSTGTVVSIFSRYCHDKVVGYGLYLRLGYIKIVRPKSGHRFLARCPINGINYILHSTCVSVMSVSLASSHY